MYDKYEIKPLMGLVPNKDCDCKKKKDTCKKIEIKPECGQPHFAVPNYFSELVHEWEKEAARYNLGIQELQSIEYKTEVTDEGERLTKVIFKYRKGHELFTREFYVAPRGEKGDKGDTGKNGASAFEIANMVLQIRNKAEFPNQEAWIDSLKGDKGDKGADAKPIKSVIVEYTTELNPTGSIAEDVDGYILTIRLNKPEINIEETIDKLIAYLLRSFYDKDQINSMLKELRDLIDSLPKSDLSNLKLNFVSYSNTLELKLGNTTLSSVEIPVSDYTLGYENDTLYLLKNGQKYSSVRFDSGSFKGDLLTIRFTVTNTNAMPQSPSENPSGWYQEVPSRSQGQYIWMAIRKNNEDWKIIRLTGDSGEKGEKGSDGNGVNTGVDFDDIDFVYCLTDSIISSSTITGIKTEIDKYYTDTNWPETYNITVNGNSYTITGDAKGISPEHPYEYIGIRFKLDGVFKIATFSLWSVWGSKGSDGGYVEYIFAASSKNADDNYWDNLSHVENPHNWSITGSSYQNPDYFGSDIKNMSDSIIKDGQWSDNPVNGDPDHPYVLCSQRKYRNGKFEQFSKPALWSMWIDIERGNSDIILTGDLPVITYVKNESPNDCILHLKAYNGTQELTIASYKQNESTDSIPYDEDGIDLTDYLNPSNVGTRRIIFEVTINLPQNLQKDNLTQTVRTYTVVETVIDTAIQGLDGITYTLVCNPTSILFDDLGLSLINNTINVKVYKNGSLIKSGFEVKFELKHEDNDYSDSINSSSDNGYDLDLSSTFSDIFINNQCLLHNGDYLGVTLTVDNTIWAYQTIPVLKNEQHLTSPYLVRNRGKWESGQTYHGINEPLSSDKIKIVDIVYMSMTTTEGEPYEQYYLCIKTVENSSTPPSNDPTNWEQAYQLDFAYIKTLITEVLKTESVLANEVLITKKDSDNNEIVVAGMTSGDRIDQESEDPNVRIWAGTTITKLSENTQKYDVTSAPFKVYENGSLIATNAVINGTINGILVGSNIITSAVINLSTLVQGAYYVISNLSKVNYDDSYQIYLISDKTITKESDDVLLLDKAYLLLKVNTVVYIINLLSNITAEEVTLQIHPTDVTVLAPDRGQIFEFNLNTIKSTYPDYDLKLTANQEFLLMYDNEQYYFCYWEHKGDLTPDLYNTGALLTQNVSIGYVTHNSHNTVGRSGNFNDYTSELRNRTIRIDQQSEIDAYLHTKSPRLGDSYMLDGKVADFHDIVPSTNEYSKSYFKDFLKAHFYINVSATPKQKAAPTKTINNFIIDEGGLIVGSVTEENGETKVLNISKRKLAVTIGNETKLLPVGEQYLVFNDLNDYTQEEHQANP